VGHEDRSHITYLQCSFAANFRASFSNYTGVFPGEILLHLEWFAAAPDRVTRPNASPDATIVSGLPSFI